MSDIVIFAGTLEGRRLAEYLANTGIRIHVCVATEYGEKLLPQGDNITITATRLDSGDMKKLFLEEQVSLVIDATHPYAVVVSENIKKACCEAKQEYIRLVRKSMKQKSSSEIWVESVDAAVAYLKETKGNVLITTGSKELASYAGVEDYKDRFYARVLSTPEVVAQCTKLGFEGRNLICMQGPCSEELNYAMLKQIDAKYIVTKESGQIGGFLEKLDAAKQANVKAIVVGRPVLEEGYSYEECLKLLLDRYHVPPLRQISLVGIGMGSIGTMTIEVMNICQNANVIIGANRMLEALKDLEKPVYESYQADEICNFIEMHPEYTNIVIALSGDTGFYSGAKNLITSLNQYEVKVYPGISSCIYLCAALQMSWEDVKFFSIHGRHENLINGIRSHEKVFTLVGGKQGITDLCHKLLEFGYGEVTLYIGEQLSYSDEKITIGTPKELQAQEFKELCSVLIENKAAKNTVITHGLSDDDFVRGKVPMTKEEIRSISISKMRLCKDSVIYDIGAGTGSVSVEIALQASHGIVYAIEKKDEAISLIEENKRKFGVENLIAVKGIAPDIMEELPMPSHAFVGGSSGNLLPILINLRNKNPKIHVVINTVTLETLTEVMSCLKQLNITNAEFIQVSISKSQSLGGYHMMMGQNPVYIISFTGGSEDETT
jgi:precorrin-6Y C5,15-methyltransferase (decarboxylating)